MTALRCLKLRALYLRFQREFLDSVDLMVCLSPSSGVVGRGSRLTPSLLLIYRRRQEPVCCVTHHFHVMSHRKMHHLKVRPENWRIWHGWDWNGCLPSLVELGLPEYRGLPGRRVPAVVTANFNNPNLMNTLAPCSDLLNCHCSNFCSNADICGV